MTKIWSKEFGQGDYILEAHETGDVSVVEREGYSRVTLDGDAAVELAGLIMKFKGEGLLNSYNVDKKGNTDV